MANSVGNSNESALIWQGFVESKLFILLNMIAREGDISEIRAYPFCFKNHEQIKLGLMDLDVAKF